MRKAAGIFLVLSLLHILPAEAYIGPGVGAGMIAVVLGIVSAIFFAIVGIVWFPLKRLYKTLRRAPAQRVADTHSSTENSADID